MVKIRIVHDNGIELKEENEVFRLDFFSIFLLVCLFHMHWVDEKKLAGEESSRALTKWQFQQK